MEGRNAERFAVTVWPWRYVLAFQGLRKLLPPAQELASGKFRRDEVDPREGDRLSSEKLCIWLLAGEEGATHTNSRGGAILNARLILNLPQNGRRKRRGFSLRRFQIRGTRTPQPCINDTTVYQQFRDLGQGRNSRCCSEVVY